MADSDRAEIRQSMKYLIIGNGVAGMNAAVSVRSRHTDADITIVSGESDHFFSRTALMYVATGQLSNRCIEPYERDFYQRMNFHRVRDNVTAINVEPKTIRLEKSGLIVYDRLLVASGSLPIVVPWPGIDLEGVGNFVLMQDLVWLREKMKTARKAVVVGGGLIGIEVAEVLRVMGIEVTFLIREDYFWPIALDKNEGTIVSDHMCEHGIDVRLRTLLKQINGIDGKVSSVTTEEGQEIESDLVLLTIGVTPQTDFLKSSGIELDERGGIVVNEYLETGLPDIWAAGDCSSVVWFNNVRRPEQLWYTSRDQGKLAGVNMAGDQKVYRRATFYNSAKFFDIEYTTAGLVNFNLDGEQNWYQRQPGTNFSERITCLPDQSVAGFNMLGRRWDHRILVRWIEQKRSLDWVLTHLHEALFEEEFMPDFQIIERQTVGS